MATVICFYLMAVILIISALTVVFAPRMYISVASFFSLIFLSSVFYYFLNARYLAVFQFILCAIFLVGYILLLLKRIDKLNLPLKLVSKPKVIISSFFITLLGFSVLGFFVFEENNYFDTLFNIVCETSSDIVLFAPNLFPLCLVGIILSVISVVVRALLLPVPSSAGINIDSLIEKKKNGDSND